MFHFLISAWEDQGQAWPKWVYFITRTFIRNPAPYWISFFLGAFFPPLLKQIIRIICSFPLSICPERSPAPGWGSGGRWGEGLCLGSSGREVVCPPGGRRDSNLLRAWRLLGAGRNHLEISRKQFFPPPRSVTWRGGVEILGCSS